MKKILGIFLASVFSLTLTSQIALANHSDNDHGNVNDDHHHGPISMPITSPITSPMNIFYISGEVTYHKVGHWFAKFFHKEPAGGVTVSAKDTHTNVTVQTTTDSHGHYTLGVMKGQYKVSVHDGMGTFFVPPSKTVDINHHGQTANFQGILW